MDSAITVAVALRRLREARNLSLSEAARRADVPRATLQHWEAGRHAPPGPALERLLDALRVEPGERAALLVAAAPRHAQAALTANPLGPPIPQGAILRAMRARRRLTQGAVARAMGVTQGAVAKWEAGGNAPDEETLARLMATFGASPTEAVAARRGGGETDGRLTIEEADARTKALIDGGADASLEPLLLAHEAELWRRAARDARWEPALVLAMGWRAMWLQAILKRTTEALPVARRALDLAARSGAWDEAGLAFGCLLDPALDDPGRHGTGGFARGLRRSESLTRRMRSPRARAVLLSLDYNLIAAEMRASGGLGEAVRRSEDTLAMGPPSGRDSLLVPHWLANNRSYALGVLGRFDEVAAIDEATDWSTALPDGGAWFRAANLSNRMFAYLAHGMEPAADELRRFEACQPLYDPTPGYRTAVRDWHRTHDARKRRRYA